MKIKFKLILGFVSVSLLTLVVGYLAVQTSKKTLQKSIGESSVSLAVNVMDLIDRNIYNRIEIFRGYRWNSDLKRLVLESNAEFEQLDDLKAHINEMDQQWTSAPKEKVTPFMEDIINNKISGELREKARFHEQKCGFVVFGEVFVTNKYGANIAQTGKTTDYYQADEQWWQIARVEGLYVQDVEYDSSADVYSTDICIRIDDESGNFIGVIKAVLNIEEVISILEKAMERSEYETVELNLLTKEGRIIYGTKDHEFLGIGPHDFSSHPVGEKYRDYFISDNHEPGGGKALLAHVYSNGYRDYKGLRWNLVIGYETKEIFAPIVNLRNRIVIISFAVATLAVLMGLVISRMISNPLTKLRNATIEFGLGNFDTQIEIKSNDEIGGLAASFNEMADKLEESYKHLEEKVQERTAKLKGEVEQHVVVQEILEKRIKELNCLFGLSKLIEQPDIPLGAIFQGTTDLIRNACKYPDVTCVRITHDGIQYKTDNFAKSELSQLVKIKIHGEEASSIEVYYLGERGETNRNPFLAEERDLLVTVAEHLGRVVERKETGEKLQLFRSLIDQSNDSVFVIEPKWGRVLDINDTACKCLGCTREELLQMCFKDMDENLSEDSDWTQYADEIRQKGYTVSESLFKHKFGTTFPVEVNAKLIKQGKEEFIIGVARDITERKRAEEAIKKSESKYRMLLENIPQKVFLKDSDSVYISCNENYACDLGIKSEEIAGKTDYEFYPKELADKYREDDQKVIRSEQRLDTDESYIQNGHKSIVHTVKIPVKDEQGNVSRVLGIFWDITALKLAEKSQAELLKQIECSNRELKDFAYIVSHDLKAPLRGIKTIANWITTDYADKLDEEGREQLNLLSGRVGRMQNLIDGVLQYSRVGREKEKQVQVDLNKLVPEVIGMVAPSQDIEITVEDDLPVVTVEETRIMQVFQNLLSNAIKYMDKPKGRISIGCIQENGFWKFSISDNGPGIEKQHFEKIFQVFQTLKPRDQVESAGVGLSVVKKIVEMYSGKIWVESKLGEGSTFFFTFPKQESEVIDDEILKTNITC